MIPAPKQNPHIIHANPDAVRAAFESIVPVQADVPENEAAYWTLPRSQTQWRLPDSTPNRRPGDQLVLLPMRSAYYQPNAYLAVLPQPIMMHRDVAKTLTDYAQRLFSHYAIENSLARREHGVPMLIGRFDAIVDQAGQIQICELDDVCSLWPALPNINPIADSYLRTLEQQLELPIYTAELYQYNDGAFSASPRVRKEFARIAFFDDTGSERIAYIPRTTPLKMAIQEQNGLGWRMSQTSTDRSTSYYQKILRRFYAHNEDQWRGDINEAWLLKNEKHSLEEVALTVRAYRDMPGFLEHMDRYGPRSITMAWNRDDKSSLAGENLAALATNLDVALEFADRWEHDHPGRLIVVKALYGARTEAVAIYSNKGTKLRGISSAAQVRRKFGSAAARPIVVQPYKEPDTLQQAGVNFVGTVLDNQRATDYTDRGAIRGKDHLGPDPGERVIAGLEDRFHMIFRTFVVYLPKEKRLVHIGGMWQATDGRIVHGGAHSVTGPLYIDGLMAHPDSERSLPIKEAENLVRNFSLKSVKVSA